MPKEPTFPSQYFVGVHNDFEKNQTKNRFKVVVKSGKEANVCAKKNELFP